MSPIEACSHSLHIFHASIPFPASSPCLNQAGGGAPLKAALGGVSASAMMAAPSSDRPSGRGCRGGCPAPADGGPQPSLPTGSMVLIGVGRALSTSHSSHPSVSHLTASPYSGASSLVGASA